MNVRIQEIRGFKAAFTSMFMSKRTWTPELEDEIESLCNEVLNKNGNLINTAPDYQLEKFDNYLSMLTRMAKRHITVGRFISFSCVVEGLHRGAQDDFDAHAKRLENKIIRNSTRLATFESTEKSNFYKDKILLIDEIDEIKLPETIVRGDKVYVRSTNGYILKEYADNKDVKRGLYPLCIPSNFVFECNLTEWAHIVKERDCDSHAHPELKEMVEKVCAVLQVQHHQFNKEFFKELKN